MSYCVAPDLCSLLHQYILHKYPSSTRRSVQVPLDVKLPWRIKLTTSQGLKGTGREIQVIGLTAGASISNRGSDGLANAVFGDMISQLVLIVDYNLE